MSTEARLMAVRLANQRLMETQERLRAELERSRSENEELRRRNRRLQRELDAEQAARRAVEAQYRRRTGRKYQGPIQTTKFGFTSSDRP